MINEHIGKLGLNNLGNTCYLNACLQLISHSGFFVKSLLLEAKKDKESLNDIEKNLLDLLLYKWIHTNEKYNPINIQKAIAKRNPIFNIGPQNDSSESLIFLLDLLDNKNILKVFENKFKSIRKCKNCNNISKSIEDFNILSFDLSSTIKESFDLFLESEDIDGKVFCNICNSQQKYEKKYQIKTLSDNLIIHMKRFIQRNNRYSKDNYPIDIQDILDISGYKYELRGFIVHSGRINGGHYYFIGKNLINKWNVYNDMSCYQNNINLKTYETLGYIFLYEKIKN